MSEAELTCRRHDCGHEFTRHDGGAGCGCCPCPAFRWVDAAPRAVDYASAPEERHRS